MLDLPDAVLAPTRAHVSRGALVRNAIALRERAGGARVMAVVKANGYGHGGPEVARTLEDGAAVDAFAVATTPEALALRASGVRGTVLVFGQPFDADLDAARAHGLAVVAGSRAAVERIAAVARADAPLDVHLKVETGLHRLGVRPDDAAEAVRRLAAAPGVRLAGLWTHLATADAFADAQADRLVALDGLAPDVPRHLVPSGAFLAGRGLAHGPGAFLRLGLALYGLAPDGRPETAEAAGLRPAMRVVSRVARVETLRPGETVSYGCRFSAETPRRIATVAVGYADGLPRLTSGRGTMGVGGRLVPIAGTVCMDMTMLDLGAPGDPAAEAVREGEAVTVWGPGGPPAEAVAAWAETIPYEIVCGLGARVPRLYEA